MRIPIVSKLLAAKKCKEISNMLKSQGYSYIIATFSEDNYSIAGSMRDVDAEQIARELIQRYPDAVARAAFMLKQMQQAETDQTDSVLGTAKPSSGYTH